MELSQFEKEIIIKIANKKVFDIGCFIKEYCSFTSIKKESIPLIGTKITDPKFEGLIPKDDENFFRILVQFISTLENLQSQKLIFLYKHREKDSLKFLILNANMSINQNIQTIISDYEDITIIPFPNILDFVKNNFLSNEEKAYLEEKKARINAQRITLLIACITIAMGIFQTFFNFYTFPLQRDILIKNKNAFKDTISVNLIHTPFILYDTNKIEKINTTNSKIKHGNRKK
jgi:hypothetical protein